MKSNIDKLISISMQIQKILSQQLGASIEDSPTTVLHYHALSFLENNPNSKLSSVAEYLQSSRSSTTQLIERMNKAGFIIRKEGEKDKRETQLSLTKEGRKRLEEMNTVKENQMEKILKRIPEKDIKELIRIQETLLESLKIDPKI